MQLDETLEEWEVRRDGYDVNSNGGVYKHGGHYSNNKRTEVRDLYVRHSLKLTVQPNISEIARDCAVSRGYVYKTQ